MGEWATSRKLRFKRREPQEFSGDDLCEGKDGSLCMTHMVSAGQGSPDSLALRVAPEQVSHDESSDWPMGQTDGQASAARGICVPARPRLAFLGWKHSESNEFSSGEEESFGSESRVNSRRVFFIRRRSPRGFRYDGGMELRTWLL